MALLFSRSKKNYEKLVENHGEEFAKKVNKTLKICGYGLLACAGFWLIIILLQENR